MLAKHCLEEFKLDCQLRRLTDRTIKGYYNNILNFLIYAEKHHGITEVEEIYTLHIRHYVQYLLSKKLTAAYTNNILKCLRAYQYIENYCLRNGIGRTELMFPITERAVQKQLHIVCDYLGFEGISTHSFRKWYATEIYNANGVDIALVQRLLQHSSASTTQRYIGIEPQRIEQAIQNHANLI